MKQFSTLLAAAALCAMAATVAHAQTIGATTNVTSNVTGHTFAAGNASAVIVGTNSGTAVASAVTTPIGDSTKAGTLDKSNTLSRNHTTNGGVAGGTVSANGHASAAAWTSP
jgi:hypothetical protein